MLNQNFLFRILTIFLIIASVISYKNYNIFISCDD